MKVQTYQTYLGKTRVMLVDGLQHFDLSFHTRHDAAVFLNAMRKRVKK